MTSSSPKNKGGPPKQKKTFLVSLSNFDFDDPQAAKINSPRSLEACIKAGVDPLDLIKKPLSSFKGPRVLLRHAQKEYRGNEKMREKLLKEAKEEWAIIKQRRKEEIQLADYSRELKREKRRKVRERQEREAAEIAHNLVREYRRRDKEQALDLKLKETERLREFKKEEHEKRVAEIRKKQKELNTKRAVKARETFYARINERMRLAEERAEKSKSRIEAIKRTKEEEIQKKRRESKKKAVERQHQRLQWAARKERIARESLKGHEDKIARQAQRLQERQREKQHLNRIRAEQKAQDIDRVRAVKEQNIALKKEAAMVKHALHDVRLERLQDQRAEQEKEKQKMIAKRERQRMESLKAKELARERENAEALRKQIEKEEKVKKSLQDREEQLANKSFELKMKNQTRLMQKKKHLLQEKYKRDRALEYMDNKLLKIAHLQQKRKQFTQIRKHDTIMQQESKRRIQEYLKSAKGDHTVAPPSWLSSDALFEEMKHIGYDKEVKIVKPRPIDDDKYDQLMGDSYYSRGTRTFVKEHRDLLDLSRFQSLRETTNNNKSNTFSGQRTKRLYAP